MNDRITELEIKLAHQEKLLDELNQVLIEHWKDIDKLQKKYDALSDLVKQLDVKNAEADVPPPHF